MDVRRFVSILFVSVAAIFAKCVAAAGLLEEHVAWVACVADPATCGQHQGGGEYLLYLDGFGLSGTIPSTVGLFTGLTDLWMSGNHISGTIPSELGALTGMTGYLDLQGNQISGTIPTEIGALTGLTELSLLNNQITGAGAGMCSIKGNFNTVNNTGSCHITPNTAWTNGALCPACLNTGACAPPVTCTGSNTDAPTASPTTSPTSPTAAPTLSPTSAAPTSAPSGAPTSGPSGAPTSGPSTAPSAAPSTAPSAPTTSAPTTSAPTTNDAVPTTALVGIVIAIMHAITYV